MNYRPLIVNICYSQILLKNIIIFRLFVGVFGGRLPEAGRAAVFLSIHIYSHYNAYQCDKPDSYTDTAEYSFPVSVQLREGSAGS